MHTPENPKFKSTYKSSLKVKRAIERNKKTVEEFNVAKNA